jgi:bifunctional ADP-heptose synthase (sugar kinase/adenylyltransferase)
MLDIFGEINGEMDFTNGCYDIFHGENGMLRNV